MPRIGGKKRLVKIMEAAKCPSVYEWLKEMWYIYTTEYYSVIKKNEILPLATTWIDLENIMLSEINQSQKDKYHTTSSMCRI